MADIYEVTGQTQTSLLDAAGKVTPGVQVTFTSRASGIVWTVDVPLVSYSADTVDRAIRAAIAQIEAVQAL